MIECRRVADPRDDGLKARLRVEAGRILQWVLDSRDKPTVPPDIVNAGDAYRDESDALGDWIAGCAKLDANELTPSAELWKGYLAWCETSKTDPLRKRTFERLLSEKFGPSIPVRRDGHVVKCPGRHRPRHNRRNRITGYIY